MNGILIYILVALSFFQPSRERLQAAFIFSFMTLMHDVVMGESTSFAYYGSAALADLFIIFGIRMMPKKCALGLHLQLISLVSIALNYMGFSLYHFYFDPDLYDLAYSLIYIYSAFVFLDHGRRFLELGVGKSSVHSDIRPGSYVLAKLKGRA